MSLTSVTIPNSVTTIGKGVFSDCSSLTGIHVDAGNASFSSVEGVLFDQSRTTLIQYPGGKAGSYTIPNIVTTIEGVAFYGCSSLTGVTIPNGVTTIGNLAFSGCSRLTSITIPNIVTTINYAAFAGCTNLTSVYFEGDAGSIAQEAFTRCPVAIVFYRAGSTGWTDFYQRPTALWVAMPSYADWLPLSALSARFPQATAEVDDPDADGMSNRAEMLAGTDPTDPFSTLSFESVPRLGDLIDADRTPLGATQHAVYVRTVPGKTYGVQYADALDGAWHLDAVITATTTQTRFVFPKPEWNRFYRVILAQ